MTSLFALITLLLTSPLAQEEEKFELKWRFEKGQKLRYETVAKVSATKPVERRYTRHVGHIRKVLSVNEAGEAQVRITIDRIVVSDAGKYSYQYDSDIDLTALDDVDASAVFDAAMVQGSFEVKVSPFGEVLEISGVEKFVEFVGSKLDESNRLMLDVIKEGWGDTLKRIVSGGRYLPKGKVEIGSAWETEGAYKHFFGAKGPCRYVFQKVEGESQLAQVSSGVNLEAFEFEALAFLEVKPVIKGSGKGNLSWDMGRGICRKNSMALSLQMTISAEGVTQKADMKMSELWKLAPRGEAEVMLDRARVHLNKEAWNKAIAICTQSIKIQPDNYRAYYYRGRAYWEVDQMLRSVSDFNDSIERNPEVHQAYLYRGSARYSLSDLKGALGDMDAYIKLDKDNYKGYANRGFIHRDLGDSAKAIQDYKKALEIAPENWEDREFWETEVKKLQEKP